MSSERIIIEVDDTQVDMAVAKLQQHMATAQIALGTPNIATGVKAITRAAGDLKFTLTPVTDGLELLRFRAAALGLQNLPSLNREMRIAINTVPGMNRYTRALFNVKRLGRGFTGDDMQLALSLLVVAIMLIRWVGDMQRKVTLREQRHEQLVRRARGLTHDQYLNLMTEWQGFYRRRPG